MFPYDDGNVWDAMEIQIGIFVPTIVDGGSMLVDGYVGYVCKYMIRYAILMMPNTSQTRGEKSGRGPNNPPLCIKIGPFSKHT